MYMGSEVHKVEAENPECIIPLGRSGFRRVDIFKLSLNIIKK
jgi:hypothetical protein